MEYLTPKWLLYKGVITAPLQSVCPSCGKPSVGVCSNCTIKGHILATIPRHLDIKVCPTCLDYFLNGKWVQNEIIDAVTRTIETALSIKATKSTVYIDVPELDKSLIRAHVTVEGNIDGKRLMDDFSVDLHIKREVCERCSKISGGYYEGLIQIRAEGRVPEENELIAATDLVNRVVERERRDDRMAFLSRVERKKEGLDIYVGTTRVAKQLSRTIIEELGGSFKESPKLVGKKDGKNVYRVAFSIRLPRFKPGSIVALNGHIFELHSIKKAAIATDLQSGERHSLKVRDLADAELLGSRADAKASVLVFVTDNEVQLLDPDTYAVLSISRPKFITGQGGTEVLVTKTMRGVFILQ
jgi:nonsense-mediated mRNA decay protein 3